MKLQYRFGGDYAMEFGKHPQGYNRKWKAYHIIKDNEILSGEVYQEPDYEDGHFYFNLWLSGNYQGKFKTRKLLYNHIIKAILR